jgi:O-antigen ligase
VREYYKENSQLYLVLLVWLLTGMFAGKLIFGILPITMFLMVKKGMYEELFIGYFFILILSDSLDVHLLFAKNAKNIYISILAALFWFNRNDFKPFNNLYKLYIPFFVFAFFTMYTSINEPFIFVSLQKTVSYFLSFLIVPSFFIKLYREHGEQFLRRLMFFCFTTLLVGFLLNFINSNVAFIGSGRYRGIMGNPNGLGIYAFLMFIVFYLVNDFFPELFSKRERRMIYIAILVSIILTDSRNAMIALLIFYLFGRFYKGSTFLGFILSLIALVIAQIISSNLTSIIMALNLGHFFRVGTLEDGSGRYVAWQFAWKQIQKNFFIGKGFGYNEYYMRQNYGLLSKLGHQGGIHNSFLTFWMDQGLVGLLIYLFSYILMFIKASKKTKLAFPAMFAISFTALFESWLVGSLSAYAFLAMIIFTFITSGDIVSQQHLAASVELSEGEIAEHDN